MQAIQDDIDPELLPLFLEEADELLPQIGETLKAWCARPDDGQQERRLQRSLHTFKGSARMAGAMRLGEQIHQMEDRVETVGDSLTPAVCEAMRHHLARIGGMVEQLRSDVTDPAAEAETAQPRAALSSISKRLYRTVRQTCKALGKKANLELIGADVELDRAVLEKLTAPFEHLLRNAIAHGLESPQQRERAGKPPVGEIRLSLRGEPDEAVIEFCDDGAGLDLDALRSKAVERGLGQGANDEQLMQLIFAPGLSTAAEVTETAGRGVGMDVVRSEVTALGGRIEVASERGKGVRFVLRLPLAAPEAAARKL